MMNMCVYLKNIIKILSLYFFLSQLFLLVVKTLFIFIKINLITSHAFETSLQEILT